jgi:hypothetical protein
LVRLSADPKARHSVESTASRTVDDWVAPTAGHLVYHLAGLWDLCSVAPRVAKLAGGWAALMV